MEPTPRPRILVPVDGSPEAARAVPYAERLLAPGGEVVVACVIPGEVRDPGRGRDEPSLAALVPASHELAAREAVADAAGLVRGSGQAVRTELVSGDPAEQIIRLAEAEQVELIVMTTQGRGAAARAIFGSVADRVARHGTWSTLLLRTGAGSSDPIRIVVPLDGSPRAEQALPMASTLAARLGLPILLMRVVDIDEILAEIRLGRRQILEAQTRDAAYDEARRRCEDAATAYLTGIAERLRAAGVTVDTEVRTGTPVFVLLDALGPGDLAVMTTHGHGGVRRWLLGSVAEKLVREAAAPVLLVRGSPAEAADARTRSAPAQASALDPRGSAIARAKASVMFDTLVIPYDGSERAALAFPYAERLPSRVVRLLRVEPSFQVLAPGPLENFRPDWREIRAEQVRQEMTPLAERFRRQGWETEVEVRFGEPAEEIIAAAADADLIVMTTRGHGAAARAIFGGVADRVARHAHTPTLLVRATTATPEPPPIARIVVPLDGSPLAEQALPIATVIATQLDAPVHLYRVIDDDAVWAAVQAGSTSAQVQIEAQRAARQHVSEALEAKAQIVRREGATASTAVLTGSPAGALLDAIVSTDLVVMTTHGHGGVRRWLLGSVAEKLVRHAQAPVLLVRAKPEEPAP